MKKAYAFAIAVTLCFIFSTGTALAQEGSGLGTGYGAGSGTGTSGAVMGQPIADFTLSDVNGQSHTLASLKGTNGTVLIFISTQCPVSNAYNERMEKLAQDYKERGVSVVGINANATESVADVKNHAATHNLTFTILKDVGNRVADQLGAMNTPEVFFLDATGRLVYRGRIDNSKNSQAVSSNDLRDAIDATLAGKPVAKAFVRAFGCTIKRG